MPYAFTELGVAMLSSVLSSDVAIQANIRIMRAFSAARRLIAANEQMYQRIAHLEYRQIETDKKIEAVMNKLDETSVDKKNAAYSSTDKHLMPIPSYQTEFVRQQAGLS